MPAPRLQFNREPAVRLACGRILKGKPHTALALEGMQYPKPWLMAAGYFFRNEFLPMVLDPTELFPEMPDENARDFARRSGHDVKEAVDTLPEGYMGKEAFLDEYGLLSRVNLSPALMDVETGVTYIGITHAYIHGHFKFLDTEGAGRDGNDRTKYGFRDDKGRFLTRVQACEYLIYYTGQSTNGRYMLAGEEYIPKIEDERQAREAARTLHQRGYSFAKMRRDNHRVRNINHKYTELLDIMIGEYEDEFTT